tara:strand:+ start:2451 stop:3200 length:750 start_codon:yes stop_codon:yes gene_type:complete
MIIPRSKPDKVITHRIELGEFERKEFKETADEVQKILKSGNQALTFARYGLPVAAGVAGAGLAYGLYALAKAFGFAGALIDDLKTTYKTVVDDVIPTISDEEYQDALIDEFKDDPIGTITSPVEAAQSAYEAYRARKLAEQAQGALDQFVADLIQNADDAMANNTSSWGTIRPFLSNTTARSLPDFFGGFSRTKSNPQGLNNPQKQPPANWPYYEPPNFDYNSLPDFGDEGTPLSTWEMMPDGRVALVR